MSSCLYLDCSCGISGDMTVAALLDLGADEKVLKNTLASLPLDGYQIAITRVKKSGIDACDFNVILDVDNHDHDMAYLHGSEPAHVHLTADAPVHEHVEEHHTHSHEHTHEHVDEAHSHEHTHEHMDGHHSHEHPHNHADDHPAHTHEQEHTHGHADDHHSHEHTHSHDHDHGHHHHGRGLPEIMHILEAGSLTPRALELAGRIFRIVAQAEAHVHGMPIDQVHFHEVGAVDSIVDIAAIAICIDNLGIDRVIIPFLTEGTGMVRCQHGLLPIPVPAVAEISAMHHLPIRICDVAGELVTPTGAAAAAALMTDNKLPDTFTIERVGIGAGKRQYANAGILRAILIADARQQSDRILKLETNIDDCSGEALGFAVDTLLAAGALDVFHTPIYMKKNRPAALLSVLCRPEDRSKMEEIMFRHTTTIGIRCQEMQRTKLQRRSAELATQWGTARIKYVQTPEGEHAYPEADSVAALCAASGIGYTEMYHLLKSLACAE